MTLTQLADAVVGDAHAPSVAYLGPEGTFSHLVARQVAQQDGRQAAPQVAQRDASRNDAGRLVPVTTLADVFEAVKTGQTELGVVAVENTIAGKVTGAFEGLLAAPELVAVQEVILPITFSAFTTEPTTADDPALTQAVAHPHALAQNSRYIKSHGWDEVPATSNSAACRDLQRNQVAVAPPGCGPLYGRYELATSVEDYPNAQTRFLVIARR